MDRFAGIRFVLKNRGAIVALFTVLPVVVGIYAAMRTQSIDFAVAGVVLAPILWLVVRVMIEVVDVVAETLIPR